MNFKVFKSMTCNNTTLTKAMWVSATMDMSGTNKKVQKSVPTEILDCLPHQGTTMGNEIYFHKKPQLKVWREKVSHSSRHTVHSVMEMG